MLKYPKVSVINTYEVVSSKLLTLTYAYGLVSPVIFLHYLPLVKCVLLKCKKCGLAPVRLMEVVLGVGLVLSVRVRALPNNFSNICCDREHSSRFVCAQHQTSYAVSAGPHPRRLMMLSR